MLQHQITSDSNILYKYLNQSVQFYFCVLSQTAKLTLVPWTCLWTPSNLMPLITNFYKNQWAQGRYRYLLIGSDLPDISDFAFI